MQDCFRCEVDIEKLLKYKYDQREIEHEKYPEVIALFSTFCPKVFQSASRIVDPVLQLAMNREPPAFVQSIWRIGTCGSNHPWIAAISGL